jgi:hypothetical protein
MAEAPVETGFEVEVEALRADPTPIEQLQVPEIIDMLENLIGPSWRTPRRRRQSWVCRRYNGWVPLFCFKGRDGRRDLLISVGVRTLSVSRGCAYLAFGWFAAPR